MSTRRATEGNWTGIELRSILRTLVLECPFVELRMSHFSSAAAPFQVKFPIGHSCNGQAPALLYTVTLYEQAIQHHIEDRWFGVCKF